MKGSLPSLWNERYQNIYNTVTVSENVPIVIIITSVMVGEEKSSISKILLLLILTFHHTRISFLSPKPEGGPKIIISILCVSTVSSKIELFCSITQYRKT